MSHLPLSKQILDTLEQHPQGLGFNEMVKITEINRTSLSRNLKNLIKNGDVMKWEFSNKSRYVLYDHREYLHCYCSYVDWLFDELDEFSSKNEGMLRNKMVIAVLLQISKIWGRVMNEFLCHSGGWNNYNVLHIRIGLRLQDWLNRFGNSRKPKEKIDQFWEGANFFQAFNFDNFVDAESLEFRKHPW